MDLPKRKHPRLEGYDYSQNGYYYATINTHNNLPILSTVGRGCAPAADTVGRGRAPAADTVGPCACT